MEEQVRVKRKALQEVLQQCQQALEMLNNADDLDVVEVETSESATTSDKETERLCELIKSKIDSPTFLEKFGSIHMSTPQNISDNSASWDFANTTDMWEEEHIDMENEAEQDDYVLVSQEDVVEGIACYMAGYLLSLQQTKDVTPNQLQKALKNTFSAKIRKSKLRKAWEGSKVIYNVASWGATAIGLYQNPAVMKAASVAIWSSCRIISKLF